MIGKVINLNNARRHLVDLAVQLYIDRRSEIAIQEYESHFSDLGSVIATIDKIDTLSNLIRALEKGTFEVLGYFPSDKDMLEEFLNAID